MNLRFVPSFRSVELILYACAKFGFPPPPARPSKVQVAAPEES